MACQNVLFSIFCWDLVLIREFISVVSLCDSVFTCHDIINVYLYCLANLVKKYILCNRYACVRLALMILQYAVCIHKHIQILINKLSLVGMHCLKNIRIIRRFERRPFVRMQLLHDTYICIYEGNLMFTNYRLSM